MSKTESRWMCECEMARLHWPLAHSTKIPSCVIVVRGSGAPPESYLRPKELASLQGPLRKRSAHRTRLPVGRM